ncbi:MAG: hypothetical protein ABIJ39_01290 [Chloroflexota bacterium]
MIQGGQGSGGLQVEQGHWQAVALGGPQDVRQAMTLTGRAGVGAVPAAQRLGGRGGGEAVPEGQQQRRPRGGSQVV